MSSSFFVLLLRANAFEEIREILSGLNLEGFAFREFLSTPVKQIFELSFYLTTLATEIMI